MEVGIKENRLRHSVSTSSRALNTDNVCTFKNTSQQVYDMALDNILAIWSSITFVQHFVDCLFLLLWCPKSEVCGFRHNAAHLHSFPPFTCRITQTLQPEFSAMCQWDPIVAGCPYKEPLEWIFHWLVSILWLNMCKPVKSADGKTRWMTKKNKAALLGPDRMWLKTTALQKAGVTEKIFFLKDVIVLRKISCRCMLQIITVTLTVR